MLVGSSEDWKEEVAADKHHYHLRIRAELHRALCVQKGEGIPYLPKVSCNIIIKAKET